MFYQKRAEEIKKTLTGARLRSYAFALLTRREYSKVELIEKLNLYAINPQEVIELVEEFSTSNYQSDERMAQAMLSSQIRKGKGVHRVKQALEHKGLDVDLITDDLKNVDWFQQAYELKVKKFGTAIAKDPKLKAKQIRFLQYRGFSMDVIFKAIQYQADEDE